ncbi:sporulation protein YlmC with PRC-barrel domain [Rhizobium pisi]|jgi:sporulation protein YlmC with PRC-barrel domain
MDEINIELLVGRAVLSREGKTIGHIEEVRAEQEGPDLVITEFHVGLYAAMERMSASPIGAEVLGLFRLRRRHRGYRIRWNQIELGKSELKLLCDEKELAPLG